MRRYGQHFLTDSKIAERIAGASGVGASDGVLEIGPGRGILTRALAERARKVLAVEVDRRLRSELSSAGLPPNVEVRLGDALEFPFEDIAASLGGKYHLVSNLPYGITSAVLRRFLAAEKPPVSMTVMLQREVGERIAFAQGHANRLGLFCGYYASTERLFDVPPGAFSPPPRVHSTAVKLVMRPTRPLTHEKEACFFRLTEAAFAEKRRNLRNSLRKIIGSDAADALIKSGIRPDARPEEISLKQWVSLALNVC